MTTSIETRQTFSNILGSLANKHGHATVFSDVMTMAICCFSMKKQEELYFETIKRYTKDEIQRFSQAFAALVVEMTGDGEGFVDVLGEYFMEFISIGHNGQFFTPMHICNLMAHINNPMMPTPRILDPACGSGRMLMAMAKLNRHAKFFGADLDMTCAKMTLINMCLNSMYGEVACMDSLANRWYAGWKIERTIYNVPCIRKITECESYIVLPKQTAHVIPAIPVPLPEIVLQATKQTQLVFEF